jgi:polyisoprenoid-binding protein YceI
MASERGRKSRRKPVGSMARHGTWSPGIAGIQYHVVITAVTPRILLLACCALATVALAADSGVNPAASSIIATFRQESVPVEAPFKAFDGTIVYDAARPAAASAALAVDMYSLNLGDEAYNAEVRKSAWLESANH